MQDMTTVGCTQHMKTYGCKLDMKTHVCTQDTPELHDVRPTNCLNLALIVQDGRQEVLHDCLAGVFNLVEINGRCCWRSSNLGLLGCGRRCWLQSTAAISFVWMWDPFKRLKVLELIASPEFVGSFENWFERLQVTEIPAVRAPSFSVAIVWCARYVESSA